MLGSLKSFFAKASPDADGDALAAWAVQRGHAYKREKDGDGFVIDGKLDGTPWRLEWGPPQRPYIVGRELRLRMVLDLPPDLQMMVMTRSLTEALEKAAFEHVTQGNQTQLDESVPEETRWLVLFPKLAFGESKTLRAALAGVSSLPHEGVAWLDGALGRALERASTSWLSAQPPFLLMTLRGRIYLRLQLGSADQPDVAAALDLFEVAATAARRVARARRETPVSFGAHTASAWQTLPPDKRK
jgi:hypothetical protein